MREPAMVWLLPGALSVSTGSFSASRYFSSRWNTIRPALRLRLP